MVKRRDNWDLWGNRKVIFLGMTETSIIIKAPPAKVWEMLAFDRLPEWDKELGERVGYTSEVQTPKDKYRVGATAEGIPKKPEDDYCRFELTESLEHEKITFFAWEETNFLGRRKLSMFITYSLESIGTDTKFTYELESELPFGIFGKFLEKLYFQRWREKMILKALENLKSILEK